LHKDIDRQSVGKFKEFIMRKAPLRASRHKLHSAEKAAFATVVRFFNVIGCAFRFSEDLRARTNHNKEFYNSCEVSFSAERSHSKECTRCLRDNSTNKARLIKSSTRSEARLICG